ILLGIVMRQKNKKTCASCIPFVSSSSLGIHGIATPVCGLTRNDEEKAHAGRGFQPRSKRFLVLYSSSIFLIFSILLTCRSSLENGSSSHNFTALIASSSFKNRAARESMFALLCSRVRRMISNGSLLIRPATSAASIGMTGV